MNVETNAFQDGFFIPFGLTHDDSADLLLGQMGGGIHDQTFFGATTGRRWKLFRPFVEDTWRVNNDLTLSLGLAWALVTPVSEANNRQANFDFASGKFFVAGSAPIAGCAICVRSDSHVGIQWDKTAFEPRIGRAWKPFGSQTTSVRAGYAIFHDSSWNQGGQGLWENPPYLAELDNFFGPCPFNNSGSATPLDCGNQRLFLPTITAPPNPQQYPGALQVQNLGFKQGRVQQFNLNIEHQLPGNVVLTAGYAGSRSSHILAGQVNLNVGSPGACNGGTNGYTLGCGPSGAAFAPKWGAPTFLFPLVMNSNNDVGRAHYDSIQIKAETKSVRHGLYALLGYTYSRTFDSGLPDGLGSQPGATYFPLPGYLKSDWGLSQLNLNHQFTASVTYDLPFGKGKQFGADWNGPVNAVLGNWEVDVIERITSGFPLFVVDSANGSGVNFMWNGNAFNRPDQISDPHKAGVVAANSNVGCHTLVSQNGLAPDRVGTIEAWFNPCAYDHAASGELGNINRAPLYGPDFVNTDLSFIKHFPLPYEGMRLDFRAEFFNAWNHAQFFLNGGGNSHMQDLNIASHFAKVNQTVNNPRVVQLALKLTF